MNLLKKLIFVCILLYHCVISYNINVRFVITVLFLPFPHSEVEIALDFMYTDDITIFTIKFSEGIFF